ncbi:MAG: peptidoglycan recognition family protein [Pseudomonadota bacterium]
MQTEKRPAGRRRRIARRGFLLAGSAAMLVAGTVYWPNRWRYIVIHHSAGDFGTIEFLQEVHRQRQALDPIDAIPYHYVIGNGNGLGMGEIASDWRGNLNVWGAHVSGNNSARNFFGLGICMIGNFETSDVPEPQFDALVTLCRSLMRRYSIKRDDVGFHGQIPGEATRCPGRRFPTERLRAALG